MPPSPEAQHNHAELSPGHVSTLAHTDPELIEYFDNFAFDEVLREGKLDTRTRLMVQLAALIACQALSSEAAVGRCRGCRPRELIVQHRRVGDPDDHAF